MSSEESRDASRPDDSAEPATPEDAPAGDGHPGEDGNAPEAAPQGPAEGEPAPPTLEERLAEAEAQAKANREKMLRVAADFENFRKRSQREVEDAHRRGMQTVVKDLLAVFDNLERATAVNEDTSVESMAEGLRMVHKQFLDLIGKRGIERIDALGQPFDPNLHEALQYDVSEEYDAGSVMLVLQPGYKMGEQLLRPALVMVSRGKPAPAEPAADAPEAAPGDDDPAAG